MNDEECATYMADLTKEFLDAHTTRENAKLDLSDLNSRRNFALAATTLCEFSQEHMKTKEEVHLIMNVERPDAELKIKKQELLNRVKDRRQISERTYRLGFVDFKLVVETFPEEFSRDFAHRQFDELIGESSSAISEADAEISKAQTTLRFANMAYNRVWFSLSRYYY